MKEFLFARFADICLRLRWTIRVVVTEFGLCPGRLLYTSRTNRDRHGQDKPTAVGFGRKKNSRTVVIGIRWEFYIYPRRLQSIIITRAEPRVFRSNSTGYLYGHGNTEDAECREAYTDVQLSIIIIVLL